MSVTKVFGTVVDARAADYIRGLLGPDAVRVESWSLAGEANYAHVMPIVVDTPPSELLGVLEKLVPHVREFNAYLRDTGMIRIHAGLLINIVDVVEILAGRDEKPAYLLEPSGDVTPEEMELIRADFAARRNEGTAVFNVLRHDAQTE